MVAAEVAAQPPGTTWDQVEATLLQTMQQVYPDGPEEEPETRAAGDAAGFPPLELGNPLTLVRGLMGDLRRIYPSTPDIAALFAGDPTQVRRRASQLLMDERRTRAKFAKSQPLEQMVVKVGTDARGKEKVEVEVVPPKSPGVKAGRKDWTGPAEVGPEAAIGPATGLTPIGVAEAQPEAAVQPGGTGMTGAGPSTSVPSTTATATSTPASTPTAVPATAGALTTVPGRGLVQQARVLMPVARRPIPVRNVIVHVGEARYTWDCAVNKAARRAGAAIARGFLGAHLQGPNVAGRLAGYIYAEMSRRPPGVITPPLVPPEGPAEGEEQGQEQDSPDPRDEHPQREQPRKDDDTEGGGDGTAGGSSLPLGRHGRNSWGGERPGQGPQERRQGGPGEQGGRHRLWAGPGTQLGS